MRWLEAVFIQSPWPMMVTWAVVYVLDYVQTLRGARLYREIGSKYIAVEGSYELNPMFQADIDRLRTISPRFVLLLVVSVAAIALYWWLTWLVSLTEMFALLCGAFLMMEAVVNMQHVRNIASYRYIIRHPEQISGSVSYGRPLTLWSRAVEFGLFAVLFGLLFAFTGSWFVAGGALGSLAVAGRMLLWRRRIARQTGQLAPAASQTTNQGE